MAIRRRAEDVEAGHGIQGVWVAVVDGIDGGLYAGLGDEAVEEKCVAEIKYQLFLGLSAQGGHK